MKNKGKKRVWPTPLLLAAPFALAMGFAAFRYGGTLRNLIHLAIKLAVTK